MRSTSWWGRLFLIHHARTISLIKALQLKSDYGDAHYIGGRSHDKSFTSHFFRWNKTPFLATAPSAVGFKKKKKLKKKKGIISVEDVECFNLFS